ncbi:MAG: excinuclease ABC subunit UvrA [Verrucomicrobiaceae bacterium]|nr:excinuclease ABC subunit UvrA [Verrucomicrobiaceae bacterium]
MPKKAAAKSAPKAPSNVIRIRGARQNNLKGIDLDLPIGKLSVITGPSGSGKSSLAFDTIYAEGQRRYVETFSPYTRQFFERMDKPKVDSIEGIPPAIAIEQVNNIRSTRSTVGTITEINDYLKMIFPRLAEATCPECKRPVRPETAETIVRDLRAKHEGQTALIVFGVPVPAKTDALDFAEFLMGQGFLRIWLYGEVIRLDDKDAIKGRKLPQRVFVVQDRVTLNQSSQARLSEAIEAALRFGKGQMASVIMRDVERASSSSPVTRAFSSQATGKMPVEPAYVLEARSTSWHCADCDINLPAPTPGLFSFNNPIGACPTCRGFGKTLGLDIHKAIPDESLSIEQGLVRAFGGNTYAECQTDLITAAIKKGVDITKPFEDYSQADRDWLINGTRDDPEAAYKAGEWYGVRGFFKWQESRAYKMHVRVFLSRYRAYTECGDCGGGRLKKEAYNYRIGTHTIADLWNLAITELLPTAESWQVKEGDQAARLLRDEIISRLSYLERAGLGYLNLDRQTRTLSGGELQRVNLTTCLGASLVNTLFVLDEPSIGLHPRDIGRLIGVMEGLRDKGNTLLVVEHEESVMRAADNLIDIGPGRGDKGGQLVFDGPMESLAKHKGSLTGDYLFGRKAIALPAKRRGVKQWLKIKGARQNNLKKLDVDLPLGVFCCVTGVSGSGKSTLVHDVLYRNLQRLRGEVCEEEPGRVGQIIGHEKIGSVVMVDQSPLARTPRSTPAVFVGAFDHIRALFAETDDAKTEGITPGFFSFNSGEGRCERCWGNGFEKIEMQFLSDLYVTCPECEGRRYQPHALKITLAGKNIHEVLGMTVEDAVQWFGNLKMKKADQVVNALSMIIEAGLGYLRLGQPLNTLSGGEAQRLKLVGHLLEGADPMATSCKPLLLLDEPTTGLHFDDIAMLIKLLQRLADEGNSLLVIEHNLEVIKCADWIVDLGPEGGAAGGSLVVAGAPEEVAKCAESHTGRYLAEVLGSPFSVHSSKNADNALREEPAQYRALSNKGAANRELRTENSISIRGAREHNLKNISLEIPRDQFVVVTGLSGSGKSSLAFDLVFAEGQRRFLDSMSVYARTFVEQMEKPDVDLIAGVPPTVAIEQRISRGGGKSTVATVTEVYHFLRLLFAKLGTQHCPNCKVPVRKQSVSAILGTAAEKSKQGALHVLAPLIKARKGFHTEVAEHARKQGIETLLVDGKLTSTMNFKKLERFKEHTIDAVVARVEKGTSPAQLRPIIEQALKLGKGTLKLLLADKQMLVLNTEMSCPGCGWSFEELDPRLFSFNSPHGWCKTCRGFGLVGGKSRVEERRDDVSMLEAEMEEERKFNSEDEDVPRAECPTCKGSRINEIGRAVKLGKHGIEDFAKLSAGDAAALVKTFKFTGTEAVIARDIVNEIDQRLHFMQEVGLGYLQLNRSADTLSGGEAQRIRLSAQLGSNLRGVLYVLDEPTIGLHPRDNEALLNTLVALRDKGNSLLVVEHDDETMKRADTILDLGPGAGRFGGEVIAQGSLAQILKNKASVTGKSLREPLKHPSRGERRELPKMNAKTGWLSLKGATANNLKNVDVTIPLGRLTVLTGVSGSGKSSLMHGALSPAVREVVSKGQRAKSKEVKAWSSVSGCENIEYVHEVDQSPIGKTSRSCPATYVGIWDDIRKLFAQVPLARARGYTASRFSFNTEGGRCETCGGNGEIKVEMNFMPTTRVHCETCKGSRFNAATLEVEYNGKHIGDVMRMSIDEAAEFFSAIDKIARPLRLLADTGLGYLQLGQPSPTLSGGEAQRIKLVTELRSGDGRTMKDKLKGLKGGKRNLYLIEEPTIGLHVSDVAKLIDVLHRLVDEGHTVVVIEHHPDVYAEADYLIDIGPEAGEHGGKVVAAGTPEQVKKCKESRTARFL